MNIHVVYVPDLMLLGEINMSKKQKIKVEEMYIITHKNEEEKKESPRQTRQTDLLE